MGGHPYWYVVKYNADLDAALQELRQREFKAGRYNPVMRFPDYPITDHSPAPGARHDTIEAALESSDADGTRSILDISHIAEEPGFCAASPLPGEILEELYGSTMPSRTAVEANMDFFEQIERGQAVYVVLYKDGEPDELLFAGYSFD
jgi:hypothetical protein